MCARPRLSTFATLFAFGWLALAPSRSNAAAPAQSGSRNPTSATNRIYPSLDLLRPDAASGAVGIISAYAGNGYGDGGTVGGYSGDGHAATSAELGGPSGIAMDSQGNLFIADTHNNRIRRVDHQTQIITTVAGGVADSNEDCADYFQCGDGGPATSAILSSPMGVAVDSSGDIYIADTGNNAIRKVDAKGVISTLAGKGFFYGGYTGDGYAATEAELKSPEGVAVDSAGNVYIADTDNSCVRKITETTGIITTLASGMTPTQIALDASVNLYVTDIGGLIGPYSLIQVVNAKTHVVTTFAGNTDGQVCSASADEYGDGCVATGVILVNPNGIAFDSAGDLYISDASGEIVHRIDAKTQIATAVAGNGNQGFNGNGIPATNAELDFPFGLAFDPLGNLYLADSYNQLVRKVTYNSASVTPTPTFSPAPGSYTAAIDVTLADSASGAKIYYTVDGTTPTIPATGTTKLYSAAIPVSETTTIKAIAVAGTDADSAVATGTYTFPKPAATPVFSVAAGTYNVAQSVKITDATAGATIYYTVNGATPTTASTKYTGPVSVAATETLEAIAIASGYTQSSVASAKYIIDTEKQAAPPVFSPAVGTYTTTETVTITGSTPGSVIYYTTNGAIPTSASTKYTAPVLVTQSTDFQAIAIAPGYTNSPVASADYTLIGWPSGIASPASSITASSAVLNAFVNTQGLSGTCYFQYGTSATALTSTTAKTPVAASTAPAKASAALTGLKANTEYYFQFVVSTAAGGALGPVLSFTTN